ATVGLMVGVRGAMLMLGERIIACAAACGMSNKASGAAAAISTIAAQPAFIRLLIPLVIMRPRHWAIAAATENLRRGFSKADDLLAAQLVHEAVDLGLGHRLAAELQAEQPVGAADDDGLVVVEQRVDVGHLGLGRKAYQRARRRAGRGKLAGHGRR